MLRCIRRLWAAFAVEAAIKAARGEPLNKIIDTGETLVTKENAAEFLR